MPTQKANVKNKNIHKSICFWKKRNTAQDSIPYETMYDDGICYLGDSRYSATYSFDDTNYINTSEAARIGIFEQYCYFLNAFDNMVQIQIHIYNKPLARVNMGLTLDVEENTAILRDACKKEYNEMIHRRVTGSDSFVKEKYITLTLVENSYEQAAKRFALINHEVLELLRDMNCGTRCLNRLQRLAFLREIYRPDDTSEISYTAMARTGIYDKDVIAPYSIDTTSEQYLKLGEVNTRTYFLADLPQDLSDEVIRDVTSVDESFLITINIQPQDSSVAIKETKDRLKLLDMEKYNGFSQQQKNGVLVPEPPRDLRDAIENTERFLTELKTRNEKMFLANILVHVRAKDTDGVDLIAEKIGSKIKKSGCAMHPFSFAHEEALNSVVPLGRNDTFIKRTFTTTSLAVFVPFNVVEIVQHGGFLYGKNKLSNNMLVLNRKMLTNPHGFFFGGSGSGKSVGGKSEVWECFFRTSNDMIIIDPDGEFTDLVNCLGGQVIDVSVSSGMRFNPFDINEFYGGDDEPDPIPFKSDFIISLLEITLNYRDGIDNITRSVIDRCVRSIYHQYKKKPTEANIPTFNDFLAEVRKQPEQQAALLASALEIYVEGSLNLFAGKTNIDVNNRLICFNTKKLGKQLKVMGMTVIQDFCWNLVSKNQGLNKNTWLWNDEIHTSLRNPYTAAWLFDTWKRGRKYGLIATGMTQEVRDVCRNEEAKTLLANSEFIMLYRQKPDMVADLAQVMSLSDSQIKHLLHCTSGTGLFKAGNSIVEFDNTFEQDTELFNLFSTSIGKEQSRKQGTAAC